mmetsp:Transcript_67053/g.129674  ORF Transcript_67053/g.129674 Transcript_67053/m.129674 type:complete len:343 (+) Transcript_67053:471-1499(+)
MSVAAARAASMPCIFAPTMPVPIASRGIMPSTGAVPDRIGASRTSLGRTFASPRTNRVLARCRRYRFASCALTRTGSAAVPGTRSATSRAAVKAAVGHSFAPISLASLGLSSGVALEGKRCRNVHLRLPISRPFAARTRLATTEAIACLPSKTWSRHVAAPCASLCRGTVTTPERPAIPCRACRACRIPWVSSVLLAHSGPVDILPPTVVPAPVLIPIPGGTATTVGRRVVPLGQRCSAFCCPSAAVGMLSTSWTRRSPSSGGIRTGTGSPAGSITTSIPRSCAILRLPVHGRLPLPRVRLISLSRAGHQSSSRPFLLPWMDVPLLLLLLLLLLLRAAQGAF